jgi:hypothetical protein
MLCQDYILEAEGADVRGQDEAGQLLGESFTMYSLLPMVAAIWPRRPSYGTLIREKAVDCCAKGNEIFLLFFGKSAVHGHKYPVAKRQCIKPFASTARFLTR